MILKTINTYFNLSKLTKIILYLISCSICILLALLLNYIIESILIPDECYYHMKKPNIWIKLFYNFPSWNGNHPTPSTFNYTITFISGILLGYYSLNKYFK